MLEFENGLFKNVKSFDQKTTYKIRDKEYYRMIDYIFYEHAKLFF